MDQYGVNGNPKLCYRGGGGGGGDGEVPATVGDDGEAPAPDVGDGEAPDAVGGDVELFEATLMTVTSMTMKQPSSNPGGGVPGSVRGPGLVKKTIWMDLPISP